MNAKKLLALLLAVALVVSVFAGCKQEKPDADQVERCVLLNHAGQD